MPPLPAPTPGPRRPTRRQADATQDRGKHDAGAGTQARREAAPAGTTGRRARCRSKDGKFILLIGAFASEERAHNWLSKLKADKIPGYIEHRKVPEKGDLALLRAGPFKDRASAEAAQKRAEQIGLTPKLVQQ